MGREVFVGAYLNLQQVLKSTGNTIFAGLSNAPGIDGRDLVHQENHNPLLINISLEKGS